MPLRLDAASADFEARLAGFIATGREAAVEVDTVVADWVATKTLSEAMAVLKTMDIIDDQHFRSQTQSWEIFRDAFQGARPARHREAVNRRG